MYFVLPDLFFSLLLLKVLFVVLELFIFKLSKSRTISKLPSTIFLIEDIES